MVDLDSLKWTQYAERARGPMRALYRREGRCLAAWERDVIEQFDGTSFVSEQEAELFAGVHPGLRSKVFVFGNGVDLDYFDPAIAQPNPYPDGVAAVAFTGAMDYWPNIDAVSWYAHEIHPLVRAGRPEARFYIVGSNPTDAVRRLGQVPGVTVTGRVEDVRPYLQHAKCVVAPLRIARGVQNKVLEALAMARPTVATPDSLVGIDSDGEAGVSVAAEAGLFARAVIATLEGSRQQDPRASPRDFVRARYSWPASLAKLDALLGQAQAP
jgi:sugar transferase (PEP-CTERM/EpsH1 system associated)